MLSSPPPVDRHPSRPLEGIRVIDMSHVIAGPMASFLLSHLGADVVKIEAPEGGDVWRASKRRADEHEAAGFTALNAGKRSLAIDVRRPEGADVVRSLARTADVFIENFRPGVVARHGLDFESIRKVRADVVYCSISGYGQAGPLAARGGYDHVVQALTGMMMMSGDTEDAPPQKVGFPVIDIGTGMLAALAVVAALARRATQPEGQFIDVSLVQSALMLMYPPASNCLTFNEEVQRAGNRGFSGSPGADTYRCLDGWVAVGANTPQQFRQLARILAVEDFCEDPRALDLAAFQAPGGGFVVPLDFPYVQGRLAEAFARPVSRGDGRAPQPGRSPGRKGAAARGVPAGIAGHGHGPGLQGIHPGGSIGAHTRPGIPLHGRSALASPIRPCVGSGQRSTVGRNRA